MVLNSVLGLISIFRSKAQAQRAFDLLEQFDQEMVIKTIKKLADDPRQSALFNQLAPKAQVTIARYLTKLGAQGMSGLFDLTNPDDATNDQNIGDDVLTAYYNRATKYSTFPYQNFDDFVAWATSKVPSFVSDLGANVRQNVYSISQSGAEDAVAALADKTQGTATTTQIILAAGGGGGGSSINYSAILPAVAVQTAEDVASVASTVAQNVGTGVLGTLNLVKYLPILAIGGGAFYLFMKSGGLKNLRANK